MVKALYEINGVQFYAERRRYGSKTFTWVTIKDGENRHIEFAGDPWPCVTPKKTEVWKAYERWYALKNPSPPRTSIWGAIQECTKLCDGIWWISTASHGGMYVAPVLIEEMPPSLRETAYSRMGFFEEDCDWVIPFVYFEETLKNSDDEFVKRMIESGRAKERWENEPYYAPFRNALNEVAASC